jgi:hypothetical protein
VRGPRQPRGEHLAYLFWVLGSGVRGQGFPAGGSLLSVRQTAKVPLGKELFNLKPEPFSIKGNSADGESIVCERGQGRHGLLGESAWSEGKAASTSEPRGNSQEFQDLYLMEEFSRDSLIYQVAMGLDLTPTRS